MDLQRLSQRLLITGTLVIWFIKFFLRPLQIFEDPLKFFMNIAPNLFGSFLIPFGAYWLFNQRYFRLPRLLRVDNIYEVRLVCVGGFGMLVINEYMQRVPIFGRTFDVYDIASSFVGLLTSYFVFSNCLQRQSAFRQG